MLRRLCALRGRAAAARARRFVSSTASTRAGDNDIGVYELDTIYALSSAPGKAGVAVIRISGDQADSCLQQLSKSTALPKPRVAAMRKLYHPKTKEHLDDALVLRFPHPKSFTGEDIVELHTHGSVAVVSGVLEALSHVPHCRAAEAGEFTERAFDNNKIDLVQVEGLADLLSAETEAQRGQALRQLSGDIGEIYEGWRDSLVKCLANTEAMIDFGDDEDDVTDAAYEAAVDRVRALADSIRGHLADGRRGEILRSGVQVAILGPPNAGKSSLLNILARRPAAIVSSIAGTTRDVVQVPLNIAGYPVIVSDTAGLRETEDIVEKEGVLRAQQCASDADICVVMIDIQNAGQLHSGEYQSYLRDGAFAVLNKSDQVDESHIASVLETFDSKQRDQLLIVSCAEGDNIDVFVDKLASAVKDKLAVSAGGSTNGALITRERHRQNLVECLSCLDRFLADPYQSEIAAEDLRRAVMAIGRILGRIDVEDVLNGMIEFTAWEAYAYEDNSTINSASSEGTSRSSSKSESGQDVQSMYGSNRIDRVVLAEHLPQISDKALSFEIYHIHPNKGIFGGRHDGAIMHWGLSPSQSVTIPSANTMRGHTGAVITLDFAPDLGPEGLLFSGSADRSIKIWDPWGGNDTPLPTKSGYACVQTLTEHSGSVVCVRILAQQNHGIVSCSLDRTVKTWYPAEGRALLLYPWYLPAQSISQPGSSWPSALCVRSGTLFVGDSAGGISVYAHSCDNENAVVPESVLDTVDDKQVSDQLDTRFQFGLKRKFLHFHSLGISSLQMIADNCFVVSLGYDEKAQLIDAISGALSSTICSVSAARFISCTWDERDHILLLGDAAGYIHLWNIFEDKLVGKKQMVSTMPLAIVGMHSLSDTAAGDFLLTGLANGVKQWLCNRNVGSFAKDEDDLAEQFNERGRDLPLLDAVESAKTCQFFSASLDGSIRCWDLYEMKMSFSFEEEDSEITCMVASKKFHKLFTGHDGGFVKVWSIHAGEMSTLPLEGNGPVTCLAAGVVRDQEVLLAGRADGCVSVWKVNHDGVSRAVPFQPTLLPEKQGEVTSLAFCKGSFLAQEGQEFFVVGYFTGQIVIWSFAKKAVVCSFRAHSDAVCSLALHGCFLFSGSDDTLLRVWNMFNLPETYELGVLRPPSSPSSSGSGSPIVCLDVVPFRGLVLSAAADGTLIVWDYTAFEDENAFDAYGKIMFRAKVDGCVKCLQCWPDRESMICGTSEGKLIVFDLPSEFFYSPTELTECPA
ncbi:tRNA modification GTPase [Phytophthora idaei]|nr:tRNA modification GTPase [Phytophthora idaei]